MLVRAVARLTPGEEAISGKVLVRPHTHTPRKVLPPPVERVFGPEPRAWPCLAVPETIRTYVRYYAWTGTIRTYVRTPSCLPCLTGPYHEHTFEVNSNTRSIRSLCLPGTIEHTFGLCLACTLAG